jgi:hypothetical protein
MGLSGQILQHGELFLQVLGLGMTARALWSGCLNILASLGLTRWNLWAAIVVLATNTLLNLLFLGYGGFMDSMGTYGVALATILSWVVVSLGLLAVLSRKLHWTPSWRDLRLGWRHQLPDLLRIGLPSAVEPISFQFYLVVLGSQVVRLGEIPLAARVYAANLANIPVIFSYGAGFAAQILVDLAQADHLRPQHHQVERNEMGSTAEGSPMRNRSGNWWRQPRRRSRQEGVQCSLRDKTANSPRETTTHDRMVARATPYVPMESMNPPYPRNRRFNRVLVASTTMAAQRFQRVSPSDARMFRQPDHKARAVIPNPRTCRNNSPCCRI